MTRVSSNYSTNLVASNFGQERILTVQELLEEWTMAVFFLDLIVDFFLSKSVYISFNLGVSYSCTLLSNLSKAHIVECFVYIFEMPHLKDTRFGCM